MCGRGNSYDVDYRRSGGVGAYFVAEIARGVSEGTSMWSKGKRVMVSERLYLMDAMIMLYAIRFILTTKIFLWVLLTSQVLKEAKFMTFTRMMQQNGHISTLNTIYDFSHRPPFPSITSLYQTPTLLFPPSLSLQNASDP